MADQLLGQIGIPGAILCKPARLTKDEYTFIMMHSERSYEIRRERAFIDPRGAARVDRGTDYTPA